MDLFALFALGTLLAMAALIPALWIKYVLGRQLGASQQEFRQQLNRIEAESSDARLVVDARGYLVQVNPATRELFGYASEQLTGRHWSVLLPGAAAVTLAPGTLPLTGRRKDGTYFAVEVQVHTQDSGPGFRLLVRDVSWQQQSERHVKELQLLDGLLRSLAAPVLILDRDGVVVRHNGAFTELTGFEESDTIGRHYWELLLPETEWAQARAEVMEMVPGNGPRHSLGEWCTQSKMPVPVSVGVSAVRAGNRPVEFLAVVAMARTGNAAAPERMDALERLAGGVAEQFNELLTSINGYSELMLRTLPAESPVRGDAQRILDAGTQAASVTARLLAFSRRQALRPRVLHLNAVIQQVRPAIEAMLGPRIELATTLDLSLHPLFVDAGWMEQVVLELAANAREAMADGGKLSIETGNVVLDAESARRAGGLGPGDYVTLQVRDTGPGIEPTVRQRLFQPFGGKGRGLRLGLSTVYGIVRQSGGGILIDSTAERGTLVRVYLPRCQEIALLEPEEGQKLFLVRGAGGAA